MGDAAYKGKTTSENPFAPAGGITEQLLTELVLTFPSVGDTNEGLNVWE
jgi:hypothetical protein